MQLHCFCFSCEKGVQSAMVKEKDNRPQHIKKIEYIFDVLVRLLTVKSYYRNRLIRRMSVIIHPCSGKKCAQNDSK